MSGLFYVYMKVIRLADSARADYGRYLLTFESRWAADELYRELKTLKNSAGVVRFSYLSRTNPQYWLYDTARTLPPASTVLALVFLY